MNGPHELVLYDARFAEVRTGIESESSRATVEIMERWYPDRVEKFGRSKSGQWMLLQTLKTYTRPFVFMGPASGDSASTAKE